MKAHSSAELDELIDLTTPETHTEHVLEAKQLEQALRGLPPIVRAVIYLKLRNGETYEQIGQRLGISPGMVNKYLSTGYAAVRRRMIKDRPE